MSFALPLLALLVGLTALFFTAWVVLPPFTYRLWIVSLIGTELSPWFGALGLLGAGLAWAAGTPLAALPGLMAAWLSVLPVVAAHRAARREGVRLAPPTGERYGRGAKPELAVFAEPDGVPLRLDIYRPSSAPGPCPAVLVVHGGSWKGGDKSDFPHWNRWLASAGYVVFDVQYRLEPAPNWRIALDDVTSAVAWVRENAARHGADPERLALLGRSAGGHLALLAAYRSGPEAAGVRAVVGLYAPTDLVWGYANLHRFDVIDGGGVLRRFLGGDPQTVADVYAAASPLTHVTSDAPPTLLLHGARDTLVGPQHAARLSARLGEAGVPHRAVFVPCSQHGFDYLFYGTGARLVRPILRDFLQEHLAAATP